MQTDHLLASEGGDFQMDIPERKTSYFKKVVIVLPFSLNKMHHVLDSGWFTNHIEPPQSSISVTGVEGLETMTQVAMTGDLGKFAG